MQMATLSCDRARLDFKPFELSIVAAGMARLTVPELAAIRKKSFDSFPATLSPQLLRHSDEQTLAALVATSEAIHSATLTSQDFHDWAIVSSSRNLGRSAFAAVIDKYRTEGPWGVSVQVIPHCTAHAVAGTISLALKSHGPSIGAGGDADGERDAIVSAACILRKNHWRGAWILFCGWSPELAIDASGRLTADATCLAAAIAVTPERSACSLGRIRFNLLNSSGADRAKDLLRLPSPKNLVECLCDAGDGRCDWSSPNSGAINVRVEMTGNSSLEPVELSSAEIKKHFDRSNDGRGFRQSFAAPTADRASR